MIKETVIKVFSRRKSSETRESLWSYRERNNGVPAGLLVRGPDGTLYETGKEEWGTQDCVGVPLYSICAPREMLKEPLSMESELGQYVVVSSD